MQLTDNKEYITHRQGFSPGQSQEHAGQAHVNASDRLLVLLSSGLLIVGGPTILNTVTQASVASLQILLEICHFGLVAYQIVGR